MFHRPCVPPGERGAEREEQWSVDADTSNATSDIAQVVHCCARAVSVNTQRMAKPKTAKTKAPAADGMVNITLRIPPALLDAVDAKVEALNAADPERWPRMTRLDWIRTAIAQAVKRDA